MTDAVRAAMYALNQTVAVSTGATMHEFWPELMPKRDTLPAVMIAKGEETHTKRGSQVWDVSHYRLVIFYIDADKQSRSYAENKRIDIIPTLINLYLTQTDEQLTLSGDECDQASILVESGIKATEIFIDKLYGTEYFVSEIDIPIQKVI